MKSKTTFIIATVVILIVFIGVLTNEGRQANFNKDYQPVQPIAFSHKVHAGDNDIQCIYCHYGAEKGRHANIPPVNLCLNCHSQIKKDSSEIAKIRQALKDKKPVGWVKVNHFPDYAYFNHSQHVKVGKVSCSECHGNVESMGRIKQVSELNMGMCLDCHRSKGIAPPNDHKSKAGGDCARCHY